MLRLFVPYLVFTPFSQNVQHDGLVTVTSSAGLNHFGWTLVLYRLGHSIRCHSKYNCDILMLLLDCSGISKFHLLLRVSYSSNIHIWITVIFKSCYSYISAENSLLLTRQIPEFPTGSAVSFLLRTLTRLPFSSLNKCSQDISLATGKTNGTSQKHLGHSHLVSLCM